MPMSKDVESRAPVRRRLALRSPSALLVFLLPLLVTLSSLLLRSASAFSSPAAPKPAFTPTPGFKTNVPKIPVTVLSGFLGSGKTTLLQHLLTNSEGLKIAVIVNDVASVNIDEKLVVGQTMATGEEVAGGPGRPDAIVQLSNGCACCSLSEELLGSVSELVMLSDIRDEKFDHIVIELSGVSEPSAVRANFQEAKYYRQPVMDRVDLDTMVTVVDCGAYLDHLRSGKGATPEDAPELFYRSEEERLAAEEARNRDWTEGLPPKLVEALIAGDKAYGLQPLKDRDPAGAMGEGLEDAGVSNLLVEQTEVADVILLNKVDILREDGEEDKLADIRNVVAALNPFAKVIETEFGVVKKLGDIVGAAGGAGVAKGDVTEDQEKFIEASLKRQADAAACTDPDCTDPTHGHSHDHDHASSSSAAAAACADPDCADPTHDHSHSHSHAAATCTDPDCTDASRDHSHSHDHSSAAAGAAGLKSFGGIGTYVYRARRPFHPRRLASLLRRLPVKRGLPEEEEEEESDAAVTVVAEETTAEVSDAAERALSRVLRSKGFAWLADSHRAAMYWSHAGSSFEMQILGQWWASVPYDEWPEEGKESILAEFDSRDHDESDPSMSSVGDRRQEVVIIGPGLADSTSQDAIRDALDGCLLTDGEWEAYVERAADDEALGAAFRNPIPTREVNFS